ncbi:MAG: DMP19 family protein [Bacteroidales bacterium]|nr:DMP19 family protein [Bacteroidales bacterium]
MITIEHKDLEKAKSEGMDEFLQLLVDAYIYVIDNQLDQNNMDSLNGEQHTLLAYTLFRDEIMQGGFCQLIQNGYGPYIFDNPFAKTMRLWGAQDFSKLIYKAKKIYDEHKLDLEKDRNDDEFMAMYVDYEIFDDIEEQYFEMEEEITNLIAEYVEENISLFAKIV